MVDSHLKIQKMHDKLNKLDSVIDEYQHDRTTLKDELLVEYQLIFETFSKKYVW